MRISYLFSYLFGPLPALRFCPRIRLGRTFAHLLEDEEGPKRINVCLGRNVAAFLYLDSFSLSVGLVANC